jgi:hypothetical protein
LREFNEFNVSLASADVAWRLGDIVGTSEDPVAAELHCPACGGSAFEFRLWPSDSAAIRKCRDCGNGVWLRARRRPRQIDAKVWQAMEALREELMRQALGASPRLIDELKRVFAENGWPFVEVQGAPVLFTELTGPLGSWNFYAQAVEEQDVILLYSVCPLTVPENRRLEVSHFLTLANYGLAAGNFELDFGDGEIRYKTTLQSAGELDAMTIRRVVRANGLAMETYLPGITAVIEGSPASAAIDPVAE